MEGIEQARADLEQAKVLLERGLRLLAELDVPDSGADDIRMCWGKKLTHDEKQGVLWIEQQLQLDADKLMACMAFETGCTFDPSIKNAAGSSGTGLIQFMRPTAIQLGTTVEELAKMSRLKQLGYVYKYFKQYGTDLSAWSLEDVYMAILYPKAIGKPLEWNFPWPRDTLAYKQNRGLDKDKDGDISKFEASSGVRRMYELGMTPAWLG